MSNIKLICDSLSDVPDDILKKYDIDLMPLIVILDGHEYRDRYDISGDEFYKKLRDENKYAKTSQITYGQFKEVFEKYIEEGKEILYIAGSAAATGTYQSAVMAKGDLEGNIHIFDSDSLSFGAGVLVREAAKLVEEGKSVDEIIKYLEVLRDETFVMFSVDTLDHLQKGGRISSTKAAIGNILSIKPILEVKDGLVSQLTQVRGKKNVISKMIEIMEENCGSDLSDQVVNIGYSDDFKEREQLTKMIEEKFNPKEVMFFQIGSCIGAHSGPGVTGIICKKK